MLESWPSFKDAILKRFKRKILYHVARQKIEARRWNYHTESFLEYCMEKLTLMHDLNLSQESTIHLLISGIGSRSLRETAAALNAESVDSFLDSIHQITSVSIEHNKRFVNEFKSKGKDSTQKNGSKATQGQKSQSKDDVCHYCKIPGHTLENCYKRRRKE